MFAIIGYFWYRITVSDTFVGIGTGNALLLGNNIGNGNGILSTLNTGNGTGYKFQCSISIGIAIFFDVIIGNVRA